MLQAGGSRRENYDPTKRILLHPVLIFTVTVLANFASSHQHCSYQIPSEEDLVLNVPLSRSDRRGRFTRDVTHGREYQPLRIFLYFDPESIDPLPVSKQVFINSSLLPQAIGFWEQALLVRRSNAPIRLSRKCKSNHFYLETSESHPSCVDKCREVTTCGEVSVPDEHLFKCRYCALPNPLTCTSAGPPDGPGVSGADFLLYVSAVNSERCKNQDTIAYAAHCQQEAELDRPIAGHVNICPNALSTHSHDQEILLSTVKHEILHALGFSAGLYAFFRDSEGRPRTRRNRYNRPISFNRERGYYDADETTVKTILREDWWTAEGQVSHPVHIMVTERVRDEARRHFACGELEGAELENQGGDGTALTHWEKRLFENEAMTGTHTQNPVYSRLTLALMEDSGWYKANYSIAEPLHWGHKLGCEFAMKSCGDWIRQRMSQHLPTGPFCHDIKHDGTRSLATTRCTDQRDSLALCNLVPYKKALPVDYQNFDHLPGVRRDGVKFYGGSVELADFCPYNQEFEWKSVNSTDRRDSRCELEGNVPPEDTNAIMEVYGSMSKCFDLESSWTERKCGRVRTYSQYLAGCYGYVCRNGRLHLQIFNSTTLYPCYKSGQRIEIRRIVSGWLREGSILCPPCDEICSAGDWIVDEQDALIAEQLVAPLLPRQTPITECLPESDPPFDISDPPLGEPCAANHILLHPVILFAAVILFFVSEQ